MNAQTCKQCGELKPIEQFRKYYGGRKGHYKYCKSCEKINSRAKYLANKAEYMSDAELEEFQKIQRLWDAQRSAGLQPPRAKDSPVASLSESLDDMIAKYEQKAAGIQEAIQAVKAPEVPIELSKWLTEELIQEPEHYLDTVYEKLHSTYRPKVSIDTATMLPVYDDTYKPILDKILERFNKYEDEYYSKEQ